MSTVINTVRTAVREAIDGSITDAVKAATENETFKNILAEKLVGLINNEVDNYLAGDEPPMTERQMIDTPPEGQEEPNVPEVPDGGEQDAVEAVLGAGAKTPMPIDVAERPSGVPAVDPAKEYMQPHTPEQASATKKLDQLTETGQDFIDSLNI